MAVTYPAYLENDKLLTSVHTQNMKLKRFIIQSNIIIFYIDQPKSKKWNATAPLVTAASLTLHLSVTLLMTIIVATGIYLQDLLNGLEVNSLRLNHRV